MHVQGAEPGQVQHPLRQDSSVRDDDEDVGARLGEARDGGVVLQRRGLEDVDSQRLRPRGDRRIGHLAFSPDGFSRLGNDERNAMPRRTAAPRAPGERRTAIRKKLFAPRAVYRHETSFSL